MAKFERYEPRGDSGRVFDGGVDEDEGEEDSRLPLLLAIGLLVVGAFAGVVWLAYTQGVQRGRADAPRMLVAASGPVKAAPVDPGGAETPFKGLKIYQQPAPPEDEDAEASPQPPTPKAAAPAKAVAAPVRAVSATETKVAETANTDAAPSAQDIATKPPRALVSAPKAQDVVITTATPTAGKSSSPKAVATKDIDERAIDIGTGTAVVTGAGSGPAARGGVALQIGAYKSEAEADAAWQTFERKHPSADGYQSDVKKVDLEGKGIWYRLRLGMFSDKSAALAFCDKLKAEGGSCFLAR